MDLCFIFWLCSAEMINWSFPLQCFMSLSILDCSVLLLSFPEEPNVSLSQGCSGEVRIDGVPVCASNWDLSYAHKVCQEKLCGNAVFIKPKAPSKGSGNIYHVSCEKYHSIIGQCRRTKGKCDTNVVFITCSGKCESIHLSFYRLIHIYSTYM